MNDTDIDISNETEDTSNDEQQGLRSELGQALTEYALILGFVSITVLGLTPVGPWVAQQLNQLAAAL